MKKFISLQLIFILILSSLNHTWASTPPADCENGECVEELITKLERINSLYKSQCLPKKDMSPSEIKSYHEKNGVTENCWKLITDINRLEKQLSTLQTQLETRLGCEGGACQDPNASSQSLNAQLSQLQSIEQNLSCNETKKAQVKASCGQDLKCSLYASAFILGGYLAERVIPENYKMTNCHLGQDSCALQLSTGFLKSVVTFFEGAWDLLKAGGNYVGSKAGEFWDWVTEADDHASTSQLALAEASQEEGVLDLLMKDFSGTMGKIFEALIASLKEWMKNDVFCQKWEGVPHFGKCLEPMTEFDCLSCKTMLTGVCSITGTLVAEVVPAFLTGGLLSAAKHGVNGASKIAKLFKVSDKALDALKATKAGQMALKATTKVDDAVKASRGLTAAKTAIQSALSGIKAYLLSPVRAAVKNSLTALTELTKKGTIYVMESPAGKVISFSGTALKTTGTVLMYPVENSMTVWAFKAGERTFDKAFKLGAPKLVTSSHLTSTAIKADSAIENLLINLEKAKMNSNPSAAKILELEEQLFTALSPKRRTLLDEVLKQDNIDFEDLIRTLYPELKYGDLASKLGKDTILKSEKELLELLSQLPAGAKKDDLLRQFELLVADGEARRKIVGSSRVGGQTLPEDQFENLRTVEVPQMNPQILEEMERNPTFSVILESVDQARKKSTAKSLKLLQEGGLSPEQAGLAYKRHEKYFNHVSKTTPPDSDAPAMLAEYIKRQKKAGISDEVIDQRLKEAFKGCD
jgi:hypothetical protein